MQEYLIGFGKTTSDDFSTTNPFKFKDGTPVRRITYNGESYLRTFSYGKTTKTFESVEWMVYGERKTVVVNAQPDIVITVIENGEDDPVVATFTDKKLLNFSAIIPEEAHVWFFELEFEFSDGFIYRLNPAIGASKVEIEGYFFTEE